MVPRTLLWPTPVASPKRGYKDASWSWSCDSDNYPGRSRALARGCNPRLTHTQSGWKSRCGPSRVILKGIKSSCPMPPTMPNYIQDYKSSPRKTFERLLRSWEPTDPADARSLPGPESEWRTSFKSYLQEKLGLSGDVRLATDWGHGIRRGDIGIERSRWARKPVVDFVEIKKGFNRAKYTDLVAEIEGVKGTDHWTFGVICGSEEELERHYVDELITRYKVSFWSSPPPWIAVFWKRTESKRDNRTTTILSTLEE